MTGHRTAMVEHNASRFRRCDLDPEAVIPHLQGTFGLADFAC